jgi:hypothetical protein
METLAAKDTNIGEMQKQLTDLVAKSRDHHGKAREEFNRARVE